MKVKENFIFFNRAWRETAQAASSSKWPDKLRHLATSRLSRCLSELARSSEHERRERALDESSSHREAFASASRWERSSASRSLKSSIDFFCK